MGNTFLDLKNGSAASISELPVHGFEDFRALLKKSVSDGNMRIASFFAMPEDDDFRLTAVLADNESSMLKLASAIVGRSYPSLTTEIPALHWFEREIHEQYGIVPENHPWLKPIRFHNSFDSDTADRPAPGVTDYLQMTGNEAVQSTQELLSRVTSASSAWAKRFISSKSSWATSIAASKKC